MTDKANVERAAALEVALAQIEKNFGKGAAIRMNKDPEPFDVIPTGIISVDHATGIGGIPRGRVIEIFGPESSGKSTIVQMIAGIAQQLGLTVLYVDAEHSIDPKYAKALGIRIEDLILCQPTTFEEGMEIVLALVRSGTVDLVIIDSVAAMIPRAELEGDVGDATVGLLARLMSQSMRKLTGVLAEKNVAAIFINQLRDTIGGMGYGPKETTTGGRALKFFASMRLDVRRIATVKDGDEATGNRTKVKVVKNKCAPPLRAAEFEIVYGEGVSREGEIVDLGIAAGLIAKSGAWLTVGGERIQGRPKAVEFLKANPVVAGELETKIREQL